MDDYEQFISKKLVTTPPTGFEPGESHSKLFPFQQALVKWALRRGRAAIFASTGLGKSVIAAEWSKHVHRHTGKPILALAPLAVAAQWANEAKRVDLKVKVCREESDLTDGINVTQMVKNLKRAKKEKGLFE